MRFLPTELPGVVVVEPDVIGDARGFFVEAWSRAKYRAGGIDVDFVQDNHSRSAKDVVRGLHLQVDPPQHKLVRVTRGAIVDFVVDVRVGSPRFGRFVRIELSAANFRQVFVPAGYAHGLVALEDDTEVQYKVSAPWNRDGEVTIRWDDPELALPWSVAEPVLSAKDRAGLPVRAVQARLGP